MRIYSLPVKTSSIILLPLISLNILFSIVSNSESQPVSLIIKMLIIALLTAGLFCEASWETVKNNSIVVSWINNACKSR